MADYFSGIKPITPTYPVRPTQPANKDREPGGRKKKREPEQPPKTSEDSSGNDSLDDKPTIDEHV